MDSIMQYVAHWIIGIAAFVIWGFGKQWGVDPSMIAFAAYTLPIVVGHAIAKSQTQPVTIHVPPVAEEAPTVTNQATPPVNQP